jgi:phosphoinositide-3-kinase regulatory subunit 4
MDIFSTGCVIAEILMDNLPVFDLANLQKYRRGTFDPSEELAKKISDKKLVELIKGMIQRDPAKRPNIFECLK